MPAYETEARDERGRWTSGGDDAAAAPGTDAYERHLEKMETTTTQTAAAWVATGPSNFALGGPIEEMGAIGHYLEASDSLNTSLRQGENIAPDSIDGESMAALDSEIARSTPTTEDTTLFRGVAQSGKVGQPPQYGTMQPGDRFQEPGYSSTSSSYGMAREFSENDGFAGQMLEIRAPAGARGLSVSESEGEVILPRGQGFEVISQEPDRTVVKLVS